MQAAVVPYCHTHDHHLRLTQCAGSVTGSHCHSGPPTRPTALSHSGTLGLTVAGTPVRGTLSPTVAYIVTQLQAYNHRPLIHGGVVLHGPAGPATHSPTRYPAAHRAPPASASLLALRRSRLGRARGSISRRQQSSQRRGSRTAPRRGLWEVESGA